MLKNFVLILTVVSCNAFQLLWASDIGNWTVAFDDYIKTFNKTYHQQSQEYYHRFQNFMASVARIEKKNSELFFQTTPKKEQTALYGLTQFSDLSTEEFRDLYLSKLYLNKDAESKSFYEKSFESVPPNWDWRQKNVITSVKNQLQCGSCWAFSVVETIEASWALRGNSKTDLSTQQMLDCSSYNNGCKGGSPCQALRWMQQNKVRLVRDRIYPYRAVQGKCVSESQATFGVGVKDYFCKFHHGASPMVEMNEMVPLVSTVGPLAVSVNANSWQDYISGVIQHHCSNGSANHAVQIVGYDLTGEIPYWIVRNSWGKNFGEDGYLRIKIGSNVCGVADAYVGVRSTCGSLWSPRENIFKKLIAWYRESD